MSGTALARRRAWTWVVLLALSGAGVLGVGTLAAAVPAAAHTVLTASDPAADATLPLGPDRVSATFNEVLQPTFAAMTVVGPDRNLWSQGEPEVRGAVVSVGLRPLGPAGKYTVNYRVTSADGHVVSGSWSFTVTGSGVGEPGPAPSEPTASDRIPLAPLLIGGAGLLLAAVVFAVRRRS